MLEPKNIKLLGFFLRISLKTTIEESTCQKGIQVEKTSGKLNNQDSPTEYFGNHFQNSPMLHHPWSSYGLFQNHCSTDKRTIIFYKIPQCHYLSEEICFKYSHKRSSTLSFSESQVGMADNIPFKKWAWPKIYYSSHQEVHHHKTNSVYHKTNNVSFPL